MRELGFGIQHIEVGAHAVAVAGLGFGEGFGGLGHLLGSVVVTKLTATQIIGCLPHVGSNLVLRILGAGLRGAAVGGGFHALVLILIAVVNGHRQLHHAHHVCPNGFNVGLIAVFGPHLRPNAEVGFVAALHEAGLQIGGGFGIAGQLHFGAVGGGFGQLGGQVHGLRLVDEAAAHGHVGLGGLVQQAGQLHLLVLQLILQVNLYIFGLRDAHIRGRHVEAGADAGFGPPLHLVAMGLQACNLLVLHPNTRAHKQNVVVHLHGAEGEVAAAHGHVVLGRRHLAFGQAYGSGVAAKVKQQVLRRDVGVVVVVGYELQRRRFAVGAAREAHLRYRVEVGVGGRARYLRQKTGARLGQAAGSGVGQLVETGKGRVGLQHRAQGAVERQRIGEQRGRRAILRPGRGRQQRRAQSQQTGGRKRRKHKN